MRLVRLVRSSPLSPGKMGPYPARLDGLAEPFRSIELSFSLLDDVGKARGLGADVGVELLTRLRE